MTIPSGELRRLPSVEALLQTDPLKSARERAPHQLAVEAARHALEQAREHILASADPAPTVEELALRASDELERRQSSRLTAVINATGVVVHTNLGRAPLPEAAIDAIGRVARGYSNLEYDLERGERGSRHAHVEELVRRLTGAEAAMAVNNNAAAVMLALAALAHDREVVISRGQLVEIGGSFRIPEILVQSGARLVEVGTTNRTRARDYERVVGPDTAALMRVHSSNFRTVGYTEEASIEQLCSIAQERGLAVIDDLGSGVVAERDDELGTVLRDEPAARRSVAAGADVVCFSADKLLGGPQAGVIAGRAEAIERLRAQPMARAVRIDKLSLGALEATLRLHLDPVRAAREVPVLAMLSASTTELEARAESLWRAIHEGVSGARVEIAESCGRAGGGSLPLVELHGPVVRVLPHDGDVDALHRKLRRGSPPVIARVQDGALLLDPRTIGEHELATAAAAVIAALA